MSPKMVELNKDNGLWYSHYRNHGIKKVFRCAETFIVSDVGDIYTWQQKEMIYETPNVL